jgi:hypothetical protein
LVRAIEPFYRRTAPSPRRYKLEEHPMLPLLLRPSRPCAALVVVAILAAATSPVWAAGSGPQMLRAPLGDGSPWGPTGGSERGAARTLAIAATIPATPDAGMSDGVSKNVAGATCGDGIVEGDELCDGGTANGSFGSCCSATCELVVSTEACEDNDDNACTGVCDAAGACQRDPVNDGTVCDDGATCSHNDQCTDGICAGTPDNGACPDLAECADDLCKPTDPERDPSTGCIEVVDDDNACDDGDSCTRNDFCMAGQCVSGDPECGDPGNDGDTSVSDCLQILSATALLDRPCPASACDMVANLLDPSDCAVTTTDVLSCLNCVVDLPSCLRECPTAVGVRTSDPELFESYGFQLDYDPVDVQVCGSAMSAECAVTINRVDPDGDGAGGLFTANNVAGSMAATIGVSVEGLRGAPLAQCSFRGTGLEGLTAADFIVSDAEFVELDDEPPLPGVAAVEICPQCGDGICGANENYSSCQTDCRGTFETLQPCGPTTRDLWAVAVKRGDRVEVSIDTIRPDTQFDPLLILDCPGTDSIAADNQFTCTYTPFADACPSAAVTAQQQASCLVTVASGSVGSCASPAVAGYDVTVKVDGVATTPSLLGDDISLTVGCADMGREEAICSSSNDDQAGCEASYQQPFGRAYGVSCTYAPGTGHCFACDLDLDQRCTNVCRPG